MMRKALIAALAAAVPLSVFATGPASATDTGLVTQVTDGNNKSTVPVIDDAGDTIVFHSVATDLVSPPPAADSTDDTVVAELSSGSPVFDMIEEDGTFPDLSANGRYVVYTRNFDSGDPSDVVLYDIVGDTTTVVAAGNDDSGIGTNLPGARVDNGGNVVFTSLATDLVAGETDTADGQLDIYYYTNGGGITRISGADAVEFTNPDISASGGKIAYNSTGVGRDVYTNDATGASEVNITSSGDGFHELPKYDGGGNTLIFRSDSTNLGPTNANINVFATTNNGSTFTMVTDASASITNPAISGDGAFVAYGESGEIKRTAVSGGATIQISDNTSGSAAIDFASLNSDGSVIAFASTVAGAPPGDVEVFVWNEDAAPDAPAAPTATATSDTTAEVTFTAPDDNGSAITGYTVTSDPGGVTASGAASPIEVTGLDASTEYTFTVVATNANGDSPSSPASNAITTEDTPGAPAAPTGVSAVANGETGATLSFTAPADDGGSAITGYKVTSSPGGVTAEGSASPIAVTGLTEGTEYTFTVQAINDVGTGPASAASNAITTEAACGPIVNKEPYIGASGIDGRITRLYAAYFLRNPDQGGFTFWQERINAGEWTNDDAATFFSESTEFQELYGANLSNEAFIDLLYQNVLCRNADTGGRDFWLNRMNNEGWSRGQVALGFSDSAEFKTRTGTS